MRIAKDIIEFEDGTRAFLLDGTWYTEKGYWLQLFDRGLLDEKRLFMELLKIK